MAMLTDTPYLPDHKPGGDQENVLIFTHRDTDSIRSTEQHSARAECHTPFIGLSVI